MTSTRHDESSLPAASTSSLTLPPTSHPPSSDDARVPVPAPRPDHTEPYASSAEKTAPDPDPALPASPFKDQVPDGGYGYVVVACIFGISSVTWGINTTFGVYTSYFIEHNYFAGGSPFNYAWVGGTGVALALLIVPGTNWLARAYGYKAPMVLGVLCVSMGQIGAGLCHSFDTFLVCQGIVFGLGLGLAFTPTQPLLAHWFNRRLSLMGGIAAAGSGFGALIWSNTTRLALQHLGVKWSLIINGLISFVVLCPCVYFARGRHGAVGARSQPFELKWLVHPGYVWVMLWSFFCMFGYFVCIYSIATYATNGLGLPQSKGAALQSILAAGQMVGRPLWGVGLDRFGRINMVIVCYLIAGLTCLAIWLPARSFGVMVFFALAQGFVGGTIWSACTPISARIVGVADLGSALVWWWLATAIPSLVAQPIAISLVDYSKTKLGREGADAYFISIGLAGACYIVSALVLYGAKRWKQGSWKVWQVI